MDHGGDVTSALAEAARQRAERDGLERRRASAARDLAEHEDRVAERARALDAEARDVEHLESFSLTRIWAGLAGHRDADLDRETAEREAARYALAEAEARRDIVRREHDAVVAQLEALGDVDGRYDAALRAKDTWVRSSGGAAAVELAAIADRQGALRARDRELTEAHAAGVRALDQLSAAADQLGSARSWSTWDTFGGGGLLTDMMKYDRIDQASAALRDADMALRTFARELADVDMAAVPGIEIAPMTRTFDVFFDNIFSDMAVRSRVQEAGQRTEAAVQAVQRALAEVSERGQRLRNELAAADAERERLLLA